MERDKQKLKEKKRERHQQKKTEIKREIAGYTQREKQKLRNKY